MDIMRPDEIEKKSFEIISRKLKFMGVTAEGASGAVLKRIIHTTADFDYVENLRFSQNAAEIGVEIFRKGCRIVTDTNMALSGVSKAALAKSGSEIFSYIADPQVVEKAKSQGVTRACIAMEKAAEYKGNLVIAVGNAPTALIKLCELMQEGKIKPSLIIGVPVGFVNVVESKEMVIAGKYEPYIIALGNKGGSNVAAAIINALLYFAFPRDMDK